MFDFHEKRKIRRVLYSKIFIGSIFVVTLFIGQSVFERYKVEREMAHKLDERLQELDALTQRALLLEEKVEHLHNERGLEEEIRSRFDVAKDGEQVVIILNDSSENMPAAPQVATTTAPARSSFFEMLKFW